MLSLLKFRNLLIFFILLLLFAVVMLILNVKYPQQEQAISKIPILNNQEPLLEADKVLVKKGARRLYLLKDNKVFREYHIALGRSSEGHKRQQGDQKTPEGEYILDWKNPNSIAHLSIHISYPNAEDKKWAQKNGVDPGGDIMIHGTLNGYSEWGELLQGRDWTDGCIAVLNKDMDEIWRSVNIGTKIEIEP